MQLASETRTYWQNASMIVFCITGIYTFHVLNGAMQEKLVRQPYGDGDEKEYFTHPFFLVFAQCFLNTCFAFIKQFIWPSNKIRNNNNNSKTKDGVRQHHSSSAWYYYTAVAATYVFSMIATNTSLQHVSYPTQVLAKSSKMIPVLLMGVLVARKRYPWRRYAIVSLVTVGICAFMLNAPNKKSSMDPMADVSLIGIGLIGLSLLLDGFTAAIQDTILTQSAPSADELMFKMNLWATILLGASLLGFGKLLPALSFCQRHQSIIVDMVLFCISSSFGQLFIFKCISDFGPLVCSIITTTRKFFSILFSVFYYGHSLGGWQWVSMLVVFAGLLWDIFAGYAEQKAKQQQKQKESEKQVKGD